MGSENGDVPPRGLQEASLGSLHAILSPREAVVASLVCQGHSNKIIAHKLEVSHHTVASYLRRIYAKLDVSNKAMLTAAVMKHELVPHAGATIVEGTGKGRPS